MQNAVNGICGGHAAAAASFWFPVFRSQFSFQRPLIARRLSTDAFDDYTKRVVYSKYGPPRKVLQIEKRVLPKLRDNEARMKVLVAPVNPADIVQIHGRYGVQPRLPAIAGNEGLGCVVQVGAAVKDVKVGDFASLPLGKASWATQVNVSASQITPFRFLGNCKNLDLKQLAMARVNPPTAYLLLTKHKQLHPGDWVIQSAANSAVGHFVIQFAKFLGIKTVNVVRSEESARRVREKGGDVVLVEGDDICEKIAEATNNSKIQLAIDAVAGPQASLLADALSPGGILVNYGKLSGQPLHVASSNLIFRSIQVKGFWLTEWFQTASPEEIKTLLGHVVAMIQQGKLTTPIDSCYDLDNVIEAIERNKAAERNGKVLLLPHGPL